MTEEERREMMRSNWAAQTASMGYGPDGMALPPSDAKTKAPKQELLSLEDVSMAENLKPCPFCGGRARYVDLGEPDNFSDWDVECTKCGIVVLIPGEEEGCTTTRKEVKAAWNRRTEPWN